MIESCSQTGHCRRMVPAQLAAQSVSSLCGGTESGIKRIVPYWRSTPTLTHQESAPEPEHPPPEEQSPNWMDKENRILLEICPHIDLPRISTGSRAPSEEDPQLEEIQLLGYDLFYGCDS